MLAVQRGRSDLLNPVLSKGADLVFEFPVTVADIDADPVRLTGEFSQGPAAGRFVYINCGTMAGQNETCWTRRAKVPLVGITKPLIETLMKRKNTVLETAIHGKARDGGPACATVPLLRDWKVKPAK